jgi:hypothetical protein
MDGVPAWMQGSVIEWIRKYTTEHRGRDRHTGDVIVGVTVDRIHAVERYLQITIPRRSQDEFGLQRGLISYAQDEAHGLDVVEAMLATGATFNFNELLQSMNQILVESGSKWVAVPNSSGTATLEERVDATTTEAFGTAASDTSNMSGQHLRTAWGHAFGRSPSAPEAYNYAIKAMEAAAWPVITPNNNSATLGHILGELRAHPERWHTQITELQPGAGSTMLANAMQLVWEGHTDRHGTASPVPVTQPAGEQAVLTAVMVCNYFNRSYVG